MTSKPMTDEEVGKLIDRMAMNASILARACQPPTSDLMALRDCRELLVTDSMEMVGALTAAREDKKRLKAQAAEIVRLRSQLKTERLINDGIGIRVDKAESALVRMREALEPFARIVEKLEFYSKGHPIPIDDMPPASAAFKAQAALASAPGWPPARKLMELELANADSALLSMGLRDAVVRQLTRQEIDAIACARARASLRNPGKENGNG